MSATPECYRDPEGDAALIACLNAEVAELRAALAVPVPLAQVATMPWFGTPVLVALDTEGRPWRATLRHDGYRWERLPSPVLDSPRP